MIAETIYKNGKAEGKSFTLINRNSSDAYVKTQHYKTGLLEGEYSEIAIDGTVKAKGKYVNGKKEGVWESRRNDGRINPTEVYKNGNVIKRTTYYNDETVEAERNYNEYGQLHGVEKKFEYQTGKLKQEFNYVNGKQVGKQMRYMSSSSYDFIENSNYNEAGQKDGDYSEVYAKYPDIVKIKGQYTKDKKIGIWVHRDTTGKITTEETYDNGRLIDTKRNN